MNNEIFFRGGSKPLELDLLRGQFYAEIWGNLSAVNSLYSTIHSGISLTCVGSPTHTNERNQAAHEGWEDFASILLAFPKYFGLLYWFDKERRSANAWFPHLTRNYGVKETRIRMLTVLKTCSPISSITNSSVFTPVLLYLARKY